MKTKHTPKPWKLYGRWISASFTPGHPMIAHLVSDTYRSAEESEANALLIAAAPELLEALRDLWDAQSRLNGNLPTWFNEAAEQARAAIAKATGA